MAMTELLVQLFVGETMKPFELNQKLELISRLALDGRTSKIVLFVMDGLGDLPDPKTGKTPLEEAKKPVMDALAKGGALGLLDPIMPGVTPGSGPAHMSLFGYDPLTYEIGRGVLSVFGVNYLDKNPMKPGQLGARVNFATGKKDGKKFIITDRRAGRIAQDPAERIVGILQKAFAKPIVPGVTARFFHEKEYRMALLLTGNGLGHGVCDTDPQETGKPPIAPAALDPKDKASAKTAEILKKIIDKVNKTLADQPLANTILVRGVDAYRHLPPLPEITKMKCAGVAAYPMYRGVARLVGMDVPDAGETLETELETLKNMWATHDFFFFHVKKTDSAGEDGNRAKKIEVIEHADKILGEILKLKPDAVAVTADHSTPCAMKAHSFHPVPLMLGGELVRRDLSTSFGETACSVGGLGRMHSTNLMPILMALGGRLTKYGA